VHVCANSSYSCRTKTVSWPPWPDDLAKDGEVACILVGIKGPEGSLGLFQTADC